MDESSESLTLNWAVASRGEWGFGKSVKGKRRRYGYRNLISVRRTSGYENVFAKQVFTFERPGDVVVAISASGNSPNVLAAVSLSEDRSIVK